MSSPPEPSRPASIGPYRVEAKLGSGGMGSVFVGVHVDGGPRRAIKVVRVRHRFAVQGIRREVHALSRIHHPGIVHIVDQGVADGLPWYAMELCEGASLRDRLSERGDAARVDQLATTVPTPRDVPDAVATDAAGCTGPPVAPGGLLDLLATVRELCDALAFLHGEGFVHRDLKPENIVVGHGGHPVIVDFGLAMRVSGDVSREKVDDASLVAGTTSYMAPEQVKGELPDARTDLYALGCLLYEVATGRPPFLGTPAQVLLAHVHQPPDPPSAHNPALPLELDALVLRLLAKAPRQRLGHAADVARALGRLGAGGPGGDGERASGARAYLYRSGFLGREREMREIRAALAELSGGRGRLLLVSGVSGVGKTRVVSEAAASAAAQGMEVLAGEAAAPSADVAATPPLGPLLRPLQAIVDRCRDAGAAACARIVGAAGPLLAAYEPSFATLPGHGEQAPLPHLPADAARLRLWSFLADTLRASCARTPTVVVLDDLQWADELTTGFLRFLAGGGQLADGALLVIGTFRSDEATPVLEELWRSEGVSRLALARLDDATVEEMAREMLAVDASPPFLRELARQSEGNPFFVAEYLRAAVARGLLARDAEGRWQAVFSGEDPEATGALPLPGSLQELVTRRLDGLGPAARHLVEVAAALGREVPDELLTRAAGRPELEVLEAVHELVTRLMLEPAGSNLRFTHDKIREVAYARIAPEARQAIHRAAAVAIEEALVGANGEEAAALGHHWELAAEAERAAAYYLAGARRAADRHALADAESLYLAHLRLAPAGAPATIAARNELGARVQSVMGREEQALAGHVRSLLEARELGALPGADAAVTRLEVASLLGVARACGGTGRLDEAVARYEEAGTRARDADLQDEETAALLGRAGVLRDLGQIPGALAIYEEARSRLGPGASASARGHVLGRIASLVAVLGRPEEAELLYRDALALHEAAGDPGEEAHTLSNLASLRLAQAKSSEAIDLYHRALSLKRAIGDRRAEVSITLNLATARFVQGDLEESGRLLRHAVDVARRCGDPRLEGIALGCMGDVHEAARRFDAARATYDEALVLLRRVGDVRFEAQVLVNRARVQDRMGDVEGAIGSLTRSLDCVAATGDLTMRAHALRYLGKMEIENGRDEEGFRRTEEAAAVFRERGERRSLHETLQYLARMQRLVRGDAAAAGAHNREAHELARAAGDLRLQVACEVEDVYVDLAAGGDGEAALARLSERVPAATLEERAAIEAAAACVAARRAGSPLLGGELPEQLPPTLRRPRAGA